MRLLYVTASLPYGSGEAFILPEIAALEQRDNEVWIVPVKKRGDVIHDDALALLERTVCPALLSWSIAGAAVVEALRAPRRSAAALALLFRSRSLSVLLKNLTVFPKALWLSRFLREQQVDHIHAHWAGTSATVALTASAVSGVSWSCTAHRWDIEENNLLSLKARRACFLRAISRPGLAEIERLTGAPPARLLLLHMGVLLPPGREHPVNEDASFRLLSAANLLPVKGHAFLLEAIGKLRDRGRAVRLDLAGEGPEEARLRRLAAELGLEEEIRLEGVVPHPELLRRMAAGQWDAVVASSIVTDDGEKEGIPVSLIEAMGHGLPAIGTDSGAIPELLGDGVGIVVPPRDSSALADAVERLVSDRTLREELARRGRERVEAEFSADHVAAALDARFRSCVAQAQQGRRSRARIRQ
jgi:glycosyltransferase involved in cell wall biosynthesis